MSFQFQCPQGHLLEGEPSQAGQQCHCPVCGMLFIIPAPLSPTGETSGADVAFQSGAPYAPGAPFPTQPGPGGVPGHWPAGPQFPVVGPRFAEAGPADLAAQSSAPVVSPEPQPAPEAELLHIPCPNGHELETPRDMLGQEVLCPHCNVQYRLREKDSVEYKRKRKEELERKERRQGKAWFNWAIIAAVLVLLLLLFLIFSSSG